MTSIRALIAAATLLAAVPAALFAGIVLRADAEMVIHFSVGAGSLLLAVALCDFALPRWFNWYGALTLGAWGTISTLQGLTNVTHSEALDQIAFKLLGREIEGVLPELIIVWFAGLLVAASTGKARAFGAVMIAGFFILTIAPVVGPTFGIAFPDIKLRLLLPIVWILLESIKHRSTETRSTATTTPMLREAAAA